VGNGTFAGVDATRITGVVVSSRETGNIFLPGGKESQQSVSEVIVQAGKWYVQRDSEQATASLGYAS